MLCVFNIGREAVKFGPPTKFAKARFIEVPGLAAPERKGKHISLPPLGVAFGIVD
jgi:hypothetical protein